MPLEAELQGVVLAKSCPWQAMIRAGCAGALFSNGMVVGASDQMPKK